VTGFDGLFFERSAAQCIFAYHFNPARNKLANTSVASAKQSPYFGKVGDIAFAYATARA